MNVVALVTAVVIAIVLAGPITGLWFYGLQLEGGYFWPIVLPVNVTLTVLSIVAPWAAYKTISA